MNLKEFAKEYGGLKANVFRRDAPWMGSLFGNSKEERDYVKRQSPDKVWTLVSEGRDYWVLSGDHLIANKLGNIVTKKISKENKIHIK